MTWLNLPADATTDWSSAAFLDQFLHAMAQRAVAGGDYWPDNGTPWPSGWPHSRIVSGTDVQMVYRYADWQQYTDALVRTFVRPANVDYSTASIDFTDWFYTLAQARAEAQTSWASGARDPHGYSYVFPGRAKGRYSTLIRWPAADSQEPQ